MRFKRLDEEINKSDTTIVWDGTYNVGKAWGYVEDVIDVIIQDGVEKIKSGAFCNCVNLKSVTIPNSVKYIEHAAFNNCRSLESIVIPNSVKEISTDVFGDCVLLRNIQLSNSLTRIDTQAFMGCISLKSVVIPASVKYISYDAFRWCDSLEEALLENPNTIYEENSFPEHTRIIKKGVNENMKIRKDVIGRKNTIHESLSEDDYDDFLHKIYNDLVKVMYKYRYKYDGISQDDFEMAIEFFINHFFESDDYWVN